MKLLCMSDIHAQVDRYPVASLPDADYVVLAGDLTDVGRSSPKKLAAVETWLEELRIRFTYVLYILGNHDDDLADDYFDYEWIGGVIASVDATVELSAGSPYLKPFRLRSKEQMAASPGFSDTKGEALTLMGVSLSPCFDMPHLDTVFDRMTGNPEKDAGLWNAVSCIGRLDIIVSHAPPLGILDTTDRPQDDGSVRNIGSPGLLAYIDRFQPHLVICGHVHEQAGTAMRGNTLVVNCAMRPTLVEVTPSGATVVKETQPK